MNFSSICVVEIIARSLLILCLHLCFLWTISNGQTCISTREYPDGICSKSKSCSWEHSREHRSDECYTSQSPVILPPPLPPDITRCPVLGLTDYGRCIPESSVNINEAILRESNMSVTVNLYSINVQSFAMVIAWNHVYNPTEGYEVQIKEDGKVRECYCIRNRSRRSLYVDNRTSFEHFNYLRDKKLDIEILLLSTDLPEDIIKTSFSSEWPSSCLGVNYNETTCGLPVYHPPGDVNVYRHLTTPQTVTLDINWNYTTEFNDPRVYYIQISEVNNSLDGFYQTFVTNNTKSVQISQLNSSLKYAVKIQAFVQCSGLANWTLYFDGIIALGCGYWSPSVYPIPLPTSTVSGSSPLVTSSSVPTEKATPLPPEKATHLPTEEATHLLFFVLGASLLGGFTLLTIVILIILFLISRYIKKPKPDIIPGTRDFSVFIFHVPETNSIEDIQTYIVSPLNTFFQVVTLGDKDRGDVIRWIEEQVRNTTAVLFVITEEFYSEWEENITKSHAINAAQILLNSAVSQELLDKFAIIVLDEESEQKYIPDNYYLKSMNVYILGSKKNEVEDLYRFVSKSKKFEHRERSVSSPPMSVDYASECTVSTDIHASYSSFSSENTPNHQYRTVKIQSENLSEKQLHHAEELLKVLKEPDDNTSFNSYP